MDPTQCPHAEKSETLILCDCDPEKTGAGLTWRTKDKSKVITMPFFCQCKCLVYKQLKESAPQKRS